MGKSICEKHQQAFETECPYCEPAVPTSPADGKHAPVDLAAWVKDSTLNAYAEIVKSYYNPWAAPTVPPRPSDACHCGNVSMSMVAQDAVFTFGGLSHSREKCVTPRSSFSIAEEVVREVAKESGVEMSIERCHDVDAMLIRSSLGTAPCIVHYVSWISAGSIALSRSVPSLRAYIRAQAEQCVRGLRKAAIPFHPEG